MDIIERKYYSDDSMNRYMGKLMYHREDIISILYSSTINNQDYDYDEKNDIYKQKQKLWDFVFETEKNDVNKNIFYLYFFERKKQAEIAYICERTQAYVAKVIKKITNKVKNKFISKQMELPF